MLSLFLTCKINNAFMNVQTRASETEIGDMVQRLTMYVQCT